MELIAVALVLALTAFGLSRLAGPALDETPDISEEPADERSSHRVAALPLENQTGDPSLDGIGNCPRGCPDETPGSKRR